VTPEQVARRAVGELEPLAGEAPESAANQRAVVYADTAVCAAAAGEA
jgi:hypothetical protein